VTQLHSCRAHHQRHPLLRDDERGQLHAYIAGILKNLNLRFAVRFAQSRIFVFIFRQME
jgi:hypothetical protein